MLEKNMGKHLTLFRDFGSKVVDFNGKFTEEDLDNFLKYWRWPAVQNFAEKEATRRLYSLKQPKILQKSCREIKDKSSIFHRRDW
jgi:hypothetical protein